MAELGHWAISPELFAKVKELVPTGSTILELGSGSGTAALAEAGYKMISIEHHDRFVGAHDSHYIYAPIVPFKKQCGVFQDDNGWYDRDVLRRELPGLEYDLILIDGPPGQFGRGGFYKWFELFRHDVPMIFDDVHRGRETALIRRVSANLKLPYTVFGCWTDKHFAVIDPRSK